MRPILPSFRETPPLALAVLAFCFGTSLFFGGFSQTFSVFVLPIATDLRLDRGEIAAVYSVMMLTNGLVSPAIGMLFDQYGPRLMYAAGLALAIAGYALGAMADSALVLALTTGFLGGLGIAFSGGVPHAALVSRWFHDHPGAAMGLIFSAGGFATVALSPLSQIAIEALGWRSTYFIYAGTLALLLPVLLIMPWRQIMAGGPGWHGHVDRQSSEAARAEVWTLGLALRSPSFWGLFFVYFFTGGSTVALLVHMVSFLIEAGFSPLVAASAFGLGGLLTPLGMIGFGLLGDRIGRARAARLSYVATALSIVGLYFVSALPTLWLLIPTIFFFGVSSGSRGPVVSAIAMNIFAGRRLGGIYGGISLGGGLGSAFGTWMGGVLQDLTGDPLSLVYFTGAFLVCGAVPFFAISSIRDS
ncbi:MAG: MFS transporter [Alphaproteobacteria bacterium]|nr:MFS transporter [Alphaproteobacteria bacterium]